MRACLLLGFVVGVEARASDEVVSAEAAGECRLDGGVDIRICDPSAGPFSTDIDNEFLPFRPGQKAVYEGDEGRRHVRLVIAVLHRLVDIDGVTTRVVEERETHDGQ